MKLISFLTLFCLLASVLTASEYMKKYGYRDTYEGYIIFESKEFNDDEEMYFKIKTWEDSYLHQYVTYYYVNDFENYHPSQIVRHTAYFTTTLRSQSDEEYYDSDYYEYYYYYYQTSYFTIKKQKSEYSGTNGDGNGDYLVIEFPVGSGEWVYVENTEEDEGKFAIWIVIVIVVIVIIIIVIVIICYCIRRRKQNLALASTNVVAANYPVQPDPQIYQAQAPVYQNPVNPVPEYKSEMNPAQGYPATNYQNPTNYNNPGY